MTEQNDKKFLTPEEILALDDLAIKEMFIPEWDSWVRFRVMSAATALAFQKSLDDPAKVKDAWVRIFALSAVNEDGTRMFDDRQLEALRKKSTTVFMRMQQFLLDINGMSKEAQERLKNASGEAANAASPTD